MDYIFQNRTSRLLISLIILLLTANFSIAAIFTYDNATPGTLNEVAASCGSPLIRNFSVTDNFTINDLNVGFNANHTFRGDIIVDLESPMGTTVRIISSNGGDGNNNYDLLLDSASGNPINDGNGDNTAVPIYDGDRTAAPSSTLNVFNGQNANGIWEMRICDTFAGNGGTFNSARLVFDGTSVKNPGEVTGTAFRDYNANGSQDTNEPGISGIEVFATDENGTTASTTTGSDGSYIIAAGAGLTGNVRIEFSLPAGGALDFLEDGAPGATNVQFFDITSGACANAAFNNPAQFCESNPTMVTNCYVDGDNLIGPNQDQDVLVSFPFNSSGDITPPNHEAEAEQIGTTWGLAYQRSSDTLFAGAFQKRHTGYGPNGTCAIYELENPGDNQDGDGDAGIAPALFVDLNSTFSVNCGTNPHPGGTNFSVDSASFDAVGKRALGDMDISEDDLTLWTVNLNTKDLIEIPLGTDPTTPTVPGAIFTHPTTALDDVCAGAPVNASASDFRPFALEVHDGRVLLGGVCSAESNGLVSSLYGVVFEFNPGNTSGTGSFNTSPLLLFPLNYDRGCGFGIASITTCFGPADWEPWVANWGGFSWNVLFGDGTREIGLPQPMLTDLELTEEGDLIIGLRDRFGDQTGFAELATNPPGGGTIFSGDGEGDILLATSNGSGWNQPSVTADGTSDTAFPPTSNEFSLQATFSSTLSFSTKKHQWPVLRLYLGQQPRLTLLWIL
ncbi:MAG TPA: proprotein convertase P-domain-containing protein [Thermodesulfobacteriota bacterium]|nr:proprotein convertase P-domain-containing protein [Thermodesulfobacteriota bacterium]